MASKPNPRTIVAALVVLVLAGFAVADARSAQDTGRARASLTLMAPAAAGGGWDLVAREAQQALRKNGLVNTVQVVNVPGAGGTIGLSQLSRMTGTPNIMMVTGTVMLGGIARGDGETSLEDSTPIARLAQDFEVIAVSADSPFTTLEEFLTAWRGLVGAPGITDAERQQLTTIVTEMVATPEWAATVARNQWQESFLTGEEFEVFITEEQQSIADLLKELGLA